jgi:hypothetical protein
MPDQHVRLKDALRARHWQAYKSFCREYDRAAKAVDADLVGTWPSRAQLHRWMAGEVKGLPYPDHCRVLEKMLPDWTVKQLFEPCGPGCPQQVAESPTSYANRIAQTVGARLANPGSSRIEWGSPRMREASFSTGRARTEESALDIESLPLPEIISRRLLALGQVHRIPPEEVAQLSTLAGNIIDLSITIDLDIEADGACSVAYRYHSLNLTGHPISRMPRDLWFQHSRGPLDLVALREGPTKVAIQRLHTADNMAKFACQLSPSIQPGDSTSFGYRCGGAEFRKDLYWRQSLARYTRRFTLRVRHQGVGSLAGLTAIEELPDGTERLAPRSVVWDYEGDDAVMTFTLDYLRPSQYATLRWDAA